MLKWTDLQRIVELAYNEGDPDQVFLAYPYRAEHTPWIEDVSHALKDRFELKLSVPNRSDSTGGLFYKIALEIALSGLCVFDLSANNPNVCIELGLAIALGRPCKIIRKATTDTAPVDIQGQDWLEFSTAAELNEKLSRFISQRFREKRARWTPELIRERISRELSWCTGLQAHEQTIRVISEYSEIDEARIRTALLDNPSHFAQGSDSTKWRLRDWPI